MTIRYEDIVSPSVFPIGTILEAPDGVDLGGQWVDATGGFKGLKSEFPALASAVNTPYEINPGNINDYRDVELPMDTQTTLFASDDSGSVTVAVPTQIDLDKGLDAGVLRSAERDLRPDSWERVSLNISRRNARVRFVHSCALVYGGGHFYWLVQQREDTGGTPAYVYSYQMYVSSDGHSWRSGNHLLHPDTAVRNQSRFVYFSYYQDASKFGLPVANSSFVGLISQFSGRAVITTVGGPGGWNIALSTFNHSSSFNGNSHISTYKSGLITTTGVALFGGVTQGRFLLGIDHAGTAVIREMSQSPSKGPGSSSDVAGAFLYVPEADLSPEEQALSEGDGLMVHLGMSGNDTAPVQTGSTRTTFSWTNHRRTLGEIRDLRNIQAYRYKENIIKTGWAGSSDSAHEFNSSLYVSDTGVLNGRRLKGFWGDTSLTTLRLWDLNDGRALLVPPNNSSGFVPRLIDFNVYDPATEIYLPIQAPSAPGRRVFVKAQ